MCAASSPPAACVAELTRVWRALQGETRAFSAALAAEGSGGAPCAPWHARLHSAYLALYDACWHLFVALHPALLQREDAAAWALYTQSPRAGLPEPFSHERRSATALGAVASAAVVAGLAHGCPPDAGTAARLLRAAGLRSAPAALALHSALALGGSLPPQAHTLALRACLRHGGRFPEALAVLHAMEASGQRPQEQDLQALVDAAVAAAEGGAARAAQAQAQAQARARSPPAPSPAPSPLALTEEQAQEQIVQHAHGLVSREAAEAWQALGAAGRVAASMAMDAGLGAQAQAAGEEQGEEDEEGEEGEEEEEEREVKTASGSGAASQPLAAGSGNESDDEYSTSSASAGDSSDSAGDSSGSEVEEEGAVVGIIFPEENEEEEAAAAAAAAAQEQGSGAVTEAEARLLQEAQWWKRVADSVLLAAPPQGLTPEQFQGALNQIKRVREGSSSSSSGRSAVSHALVESMASAVASLGRIRGGEGADAEAWLAASAGHVEARRVWQAARVEAVARAAQAFLSTPSLQRTAFGRQWMEEDPRLQLLVGLCQQWPGVGAAAVAGVRARVEAGLPGGFFHLVGGGGGEEGGGSPPPAGSSSSSAAAAAAWPEQVSPLARKQLVLALTAVAMKRVAQL